MSDQQSNTRIEIVNPDNLDIRPIQYIHSYLNSEGFRLRLHYINGQDRLKEYANNIRTRANSPIKLYATDEPSALGAIAKVFQFWKPWSERIARSSRESAYSPVHNTISISPQNDYSDVGPDLDFVIAHEYGHKIQPYQMIGNYYNYVSNAPWEYKNIHSTKKLDKNNEREYVHDKVYDETYSDLIGTRYDLFKNGIYDSRSNNKFTEGDYDKYIECLKNNNKLNRLVRQFDKENFIRLINEVAQNNMQQDNQNLYAKRGTKLIPRKFKQLK